MAEPHSRRRKTFIQSTSLTIRINLQAHIMLRDTDKWFALFLMNPKFHQFWNTYQAVSLHTVVASKTNKRRTLRPYGCNFDSAYTLRGKAKLKVNNIKRIYQSNVYINHSEFNFPPKAYSLYANRRVLLAVKLTLLYYSV